MFSCALPHGSITVDFPRGTIVSLQCGERELIHTPIPLFTLRLRRTDGSSIMLDPSKAGRWTGVPDEDSICYRDFPDAPGIEVFVILTVYNNIRWNICIGNRGNLLCEWVDFPGIVLPPLKKNGGIGEILFPYNEGVIVDDMEQRMQSPFRPEEPEYPSEGSYAVFPNTVQSQFMCYLFDGHGLYMGTEDESRSVKGIDFLPERDGVSLRFRHFCGVERGADFGIQYETVWKFFDGTWEDGAEIYRRWFEKHLPAGVRKIADNPALPDWYEDTPLIINCPVSGGADTDVTEPNVLSSCTNALPIIDEIAQKTGARILVLLMHWENTVPLASPFIWPPFGGEENFRTFLDEVHRRGNLLGVYCSGFGYTLQSKQIRTYSNTKENLSHAACAGPDGNISLSRICTAQHPGYDLCIHTYAARKILDEAYRPLLTGGIDYAQILDQNHGGGQYFCYATDHGHPPAPGAWMTESMQNFLGSWNRTAGTTLLGCKSAAAEPFIGNLLFSDNRFELNYCIGRPVPLYAYLYHEYLRNFSGTQLSCELSSDTDTMRLRMAYSFAAGDCMSLILTPEGKLLHSWEFRNSESDPDMDKCLQFAANMQKFLSETGEYLSRGRMIKPHPYQCTVRRYKMSNTPDFTCEVPDALSTAWEYDGRRMQLFVNHTDSPLQLSFENESFTVEALSAVMRPLP